MRRPLFRIVAASTLLVLVAALTGGTASAGPTFSIVNAGSSNGYEPGIDLMADGTMFVNSPQGGSGTQSGLWRKRPSDASFQKIAFPSPASRYPGGFDNDVEIKGSRVYMLDLWVGSNSILRSDDGGDTWTGGGPISTLGPSDREWIAVGKTVNGQDTVFALTAIIGGVSLTSPAILAISRDSGETFTEHTPVPLPTPHAGFSGQLLADDTGFVGMSYIEGSKVKFAGSPDEGKTWNVADISAFQDSFAQHIQGVAMTGNTLHVVWISSVGFGVKVHYARSEDKGLTWTGGAGEVFNGRAVPTALSSAGSSMFPWVAARGNKVAATWYQAYTSATGPLLSVPTDPNSVPANTRWRIMYAESLDGGVTWTTPVAADAAPAQSGIICTQGIGCTSGRQLGDFQQVVIDAAGRSHIVYARSGGARVASQN